MTGNILGVEGDHTIREDREFGKVSLTNKNLLEAEIIAFLVDISKYIQQKMFEISREGYLTLMEEFYFFLTGQFRNGFARPVTSQTGQMTYRRQLHF